MPELIRMATEEAGIANPEPGFVALFSKDRFPGATVELRWVRDESGGNTYSWRGQDGWLCPALLRYFERPPETLYIEVRPAEDQTDFESWFTAKMQQVGPQIGALLGDQVLSREVGVVQDWLRSFAYDAWQAGSRVRG